MEDKHYRSLNEENIIKPESRTVEGYAVVFDSLSVNLGFYETIARGAITQELVDNCDVFALFDHDRDKVLARSNHSNGSLNLIVDEKGLKYRFDAPQTSLGNDLLEYIKRGDISKSSFCFTISSEPNSEKWEKRDGKIYRTIYKIDKIIDVSCVWNPAYESTSCGKRFNEIESLSKEIDDKMNLLKLEIELM